MLKSVSSKENIDFNLLNKIKTNDKEITLGQAADIIFSIHKANINLEIKKNK